MVIERARCKTIKRTGERCNNYAVPGASVCRFHGGANPRVQDKAQVVVLQDAARDALCDYTIVPVEDPLTKLKEIAGELIALKEFLRGRVAEITEIRNQSRDGVEQLRAEFVAYQKALNDVIAALATIAKLNIDERLTRIEQAKAEIIINAIDVALAKVGLSNEQASVARQEVARQLRAAG